MHRWHGLVVSSPLEEIGASTYLVVRSNPKYKSLLRVATLKLSWPLSLLLPLRIIALGLKENGLWMIHCKEW
jgi:hypothetical protein